MAQQYYHNKVNKQIQVLPFETDVGDRMQDCVGYGSWVPVLLSCMKYIKVAVCNRGLWALCTYIF